MSMNRQHNKSPPCSTSNPITQTNEINHEPSHTDENDNQWPRFLIMEATAKNIPLNLIVLTLKTAVDGMANGRPKQCKPMKSGSIFIEVEKRHQSKNLLRTTMLMGYIPVKVTPHRTLNSRKFVIKCTELDNTEEDEIKKRTRTTRNYCCQENISALQSICDDDQRARHSGKNQHWILEKRNKTLHSKPSKIFPMPEIWTHKKIMQRKASLCWMWWGRAQCRWLSKWPKMCKLWRRPPCYFQRLPNMETRERHCDPKI